MRPILLLAGILLLPGAPAHAQDLVRGCFAAAAPATRDEAAEVRIVAVGDVGTAKGGANREVALGLERFLEERGFDPAAILFLGDNFYPDGLIGSGASCGDPDASPERIGAQIVEILGPYGFVHSRTTVHALAGNHDYDCSERGSLENQRDLVRWPGVDGAWDRGWHFVDGLPEEIVHDEWLHLIALDSTPMIADPGFLRASLRRLEERLADSRARWRIVAAHHPLESAGFHAGHAGTLHRIGRWFYPVASFLQFGSTLYGRNNVYEDEYRRYLEGLDDVFARHRVDLFLAGHEHALELLDAKGPRPPTVISGSGAKCDPVTRIGATQFAATRHGFVVVAASDESLTVEFVGTASCEEREVCARPSEGDDPRWHSLYRHVLGEG